MTKEQKAQEKAAKAAQKAADAAAKQAEKDAAKASKNMKVTEPDPEHVPDSDSEVQDKPKTPAFGAESNELHKKTGECLHNIMRAADVCLNINPEANIQDQICSIIRHGLRAFELHTGRPFDTDLG